MTFAIPCRNAGSHLRPLLESLLAQSRQDFRLLLIDDGSDDGSAELARRVAGDRIRVVVSPRPRGLAGNFQHCADQVRTRFFCLAHQDDIYEKDYLSTLLPALQARPQAALAHCRARAIAADGAPLSGPAERYKDRLWRGRQGDGPVANYQRLYRGNFICCPSVLFRTEHFRGVGGFRTDLEFALDWDLWLRLARAGRDFVGVPRVLIRYRRHDVASSRGSTRSLVRFREELELLTAARRNGIDDGLLPADTAPSPALRNNVLHEALDDLVLRDDEGVMQKLRFLRDYAPELWNDPYVRTFRALRRLGPVGSRLLALGRSTAVRLGLGGARR